MPKGVPVNVVGYWFPTDGKGPVANDTNVVLRSATNPVLAHMFLDYILDLPNVLENISFNGYMQPLTGVTPQVLVKEQILPPSLLSTVVLPSYFRRGVAQLQLARRRGRPVAAGLARRQQRHLKDKGPHVRRQKKNAFWIALAAPGIIWLVLLFIVPFYAVLAIAMGKLNQLFESPVAVWNPFAWSSENFIDVWHDLFGSAAFAGPIVVQDDRLRGHRQPALPAHRLSGRVLRGPLRRPQQGAVPGPAHRAVLDQLHDAHAGLGRPAAGQRAS